MFGLGGLFLCFNGSYLETCSTIDTLALVDLRHETTDGADRPPASLDWY